MNPQRLAELLERFPRLTIGLMGDLFLDRYLEIDPQRASARELVEHLAHRGVLS